MHAEAMTPTEKMEEMYETVELPDGRSARLQYMMQESRRIREARAKGQISTAEAAKLLHRLKRRATKKTSLKLW